MSTKDAPVKYRRGRMGADTRKLDAAQKATQAQLNELSARIDAQFGSARGSILYRGESLWSALAPGTSGHFLKTLGAGADPAWAAISIPSLSLIATRPVDGVEVFTDIELYQECVFLLDNVTATNSGQRGLQVSVDSAATWLDTNDYGHFGGAGTTDQDYAQITTTNAATAMDGIAHLFSPNIASLRKYLRVSGVNPNVFVDTTDIITDVRIVNSVGTPNGGTIYFLARPA